MSPILNNIVSYKFILSHNFIKKNNSKNFTYIVKNHNLFILTNL